jgi:zinc transporter
MAGLLGMNVGGIPFAEDGNGFWAVVATLMAFTTAVGYLVLRKFRE